MVKMTGKHGGEPIDMGGYVEKMITSSILKLLSGHFSADIPVGLNVF